MKTRTGLRFMLATIGLIIVLPAAVHAASPPETTVQSFAGRYSTHFRNGMVSGENYWSDDVVEIVPVSEQAAYIRVSLQFYNGHSCDIWGVGRAEGAHIVYHDPNPPPLETLPHCTLSLSHHGPDLLIEDAENTCKSYCGMRGSLMHQTLPLTSRRPITYMQRLQNSRNYREAMSAWKGQAAP
ncbi:MAG: hypothetical protein ABF893_04915 [Gluconacetobacter liquefaciens]